MPKVFCIDCPRCGALRDEARLQVVSANVEMSGVSLEEDGFVLTDAESTNTSNEVVWCNACETHFPLDECYADRREKRNKEREMAMRKLAAVYGLDPSDPLKMAAEIIERFHAVKEQA